MGILRGCIIKGLYIIQWVYLKNVSGNIFAKKKVVAFLPQISGHKRVDSINSYSGLAEEESLALGKILGRPAANSSYNEHLQSTEADITPKPSNSNMGLFDKPNVFQNCTFNMNTKL